MPDDLENAVTQIDSVLASAKEVDRAIVMGRLNSEFSQDHLSQARHLCQRIEAFAGLLKLMLNYRRMGNSDAGRAYWGFVEEFESLVSGETHVVNLPRLMNTMIKHNLPAIRLRRDCPPVAVNGTSERELKLAPLTVAVDAFAMRLTAMAGVANTFPREIRVPLPCEHDASEKFTGVVEREENGRVSVIWILRGDAAVPGARDGG